MDSDLSSRLESILSDPGQMAKLTEMAKGLMGQMGQSPEPSPGADDRPPQTPVTETDTKFLSALGKAFSGGEASRSTALLMAMRPYMKPEKQEKLDRAMKIARMVHIAGAVMGEYGGGHGL